MNKKNPDDMDERNEMDEKQSLGLSPAANPGVDSSKPGDPTGTSLAPSPLPSNLNDPSPPGHPRINNIKISNIGKPKLKEERGTMFE